MHQVCLGAIRLMAVERLRQNFWVLRVPASLLAVLLPMVCGDLPIVLASQPLERTVSIDISTLSPHRQPIVLAQTNSLSTLEQGIVNEINRARTNPAEYASDLENLRQYYSGNRLELPGEIPLITKEGVRAVDEAIEFLQSTAPLPALRVSRGMSLAAKAHVSDQGPLGGMGHIGSDRSTTSDRVSRYGEWQRTLGENISYGEDTALGVVMQLIIDDGVASRGHRENIFNPEFRVTGVACGPHAGYGTMCAITFAGGYTERRE